MAILLTWLPATDVGDIIGIRTFEEFSAAPLRIPKSILFSLGGWKLERVLYCTLKGGFIHAGHTGTVVLPRETLYVHLQWDWSDGRSEIKQAHLME